MGLIAIGATVSDSIYTLIDTLEDAPNERLALSNDVTDFQLVLSKVIEVRNLERFQWRMIEQMVALIW